MQGKKFKISLVVLVALTIINCIIFINRDRFQYLPYASYNSLYSGCDENCKVKWAQPAKIFSSSELTEANKILLSNTDVKSKQSTIEKIQTIGAFIYNKFHNQYSRPSDSVMFLSALEKYKILSRSPKENMWCGDFAMMFLLFSSSQNILCRSIEIYAEDGDHHVVNECYVPELNQWIMTDVPNNTLLPLSNNNQYLNIQNFRSQLKTNAPVLRLSSINNKIVVDTIDKNLPFIVSYFKANNSFYYYHTTNLKSVYIFERKLKRYLLPTSWYDLYNDKKQSNFPFFLKISFLILWIINVLITGWLLLLINYDRSKKHKKKL